MGTTGHSIPGSVVRDFRSCWKDLVVADVAYKVIGFVLLTPLGAILFRLFVALSGQSVLADADILFFILNPLGWFALVGIAGVSIGLVALQQTALMTIVYGATAGHHTGILSALQFTARRAWTVLRITARMAARTLLIVAPFLVAGGLVYGALLSEYDINYYLAQRPPVFWVAGALLGCIVLLCLAVLIRVVSGWLFALPLVLFELVAVREALRVSRQRVSGRRSTVAVWMVAWSLLSLLLSALASGAVSLLGQTFLPGPAGSLGLVVLSVGGLLLIWIAANAAVTLMSTTTLAVLLVNLYRAFGAREWTPAAAVERLHAPASALAFTLTGKRLLGAAALGVAIAVLVGAAAIMSVRTEDHTAITAHRGASAAAPENTLAAVRRAIADGADWVEIDVQETADGHIVVVHDRDLMKLAGVNLKIGEATLSELQAIDVGSWFAPEFAGERLPTLREVLAVCKGKIGVNIELKFHGHARRLEQRVVELVEASGMAPHVVIMSLNRGAVQKVKALRPQWRVGLLTAVAVGRLTTVEADFLAVSARLATRSFVRSAHRRGKDVHVWTVNDPLTMSTMMARGVDNIITDEPAMARSVLEQRAQMTLVERLCLELAWLLGAAPEAALNIAI